MNQSRVLIIVDVQNDFCPGGSLAVPGGDRIVPVINHISGTFPLVVASQDWHPAGHVSFASQHAGKRPFDSTTIDGREWTLWPDHCAKGTVGAELHSGLDTGPVTLIIRKGSKPHLDSYSVFFENDQETSTGLHFYLKGMKVSQVYLCGLALDVCVYFSALDAVGLGYRTYVVEDAAVGIDSPTGSLDMAVKDMKEKGVEFVRSERL